MMLPQIANLDLNSTINTNSKTSTNKAGKSFLFDFKNGDFVVKDGKLVQVTDIEALEVWIEKILRTEKFKFKVYEKKNRNQEYGINIYDLIIGNTYPNSFIDAEIKREVTDALLRNPLIKSLDNWSIVKDNPTLKVAFRVNLTNGETFSQEVSY